MKNTKKRGPGRPPKDAAAQPVNTKPQKQKRRKTKAEAREAKIKTAIALLKAHGFKITREVVEVKEF